MKEGMALLHYINTLSELTGAEIDLAAINQASARFVGECFGRGKNLNDLWGKPTK